MKSKVLAEEPPSELPLDQQYTFMDSTICHYPEFENYQIYSGSVVPEEKKTLFSKVFNLIGYGVAKAAPYVGNACKFAVNDVALPTAKYVGTKAVHGIGHVLTEVGKDLKKV